MTILVGYPQIHSHAGFVNRWTVPFAFFPLENAPREHEVGHYSSGSEERRLQRCVEEVVQLLRCMEPA